MWARFLCGRFCGSTRRTPLHSPVIPSLSKPLQHLHPLSNPLTLKPPSPSSHAMGARLLSGRFCGSTRHTFLHSPVIPSLSNPLQPLHPLSNPLSPNQSSSSSHAMGARLLSGRFCGSTRHTFLHSPVIPSLSNPLQPLHPLSNPLSPNQSSSSSHAMWACLLSGRFCGSIRSTFLGSRVIPSLSNPLQPLQPLFQPQLLPVLFHQVRFAGFDKKSKRPNKKGKKKLMIYSCKICRSRYTTNNKNYLYAHRALHEKGYYEKDGSVSKKWKYRDVDGLQTTNERKKLQLVEAILEGEKDE